MGASPPSCGVAGVRGRQRSAISVSAWDGPSRRAAHAWSGLGVRSERYMCGCVRRAAMSRRAATARSGISGWTIRDPSCLPLDGRRNSADPRPNLRGEAVRMQRCELHAAATARAFRALGIFPHFMHCSLVRSQNNRKGSLGIVRSQKNHLYAVKKTLVRSQNNKTCLVHKPSRWSFEKCRMAEAATAPECPRTPRRRPATSKAAKRTNAPAQTVAWTRLLNFTAGRRTHTMRTFRTRHGSLWQAHRHQDLPGR
jgi:hypothetical protein